MQIGADWDRSQALARPCRVHWSALLGQEKNAQEANFALIDGLMKDGIAFVTRLPTDHTGDSPESSDANSPSLARLAESVSATYQCPEDRIFMSDDISPSSLERSGTHSTARYGMFDHLVPPPRTLPTPI